MIRVAFIIGIINTLYRFAVDADGFAGMDHRALKGILLVTPGDEAVTAGIVTVTRVLSSHHNIALTAQTLLIVGTILSRTFQIRHILPPSAPLTLQIHGKQRWKRQIRTKVCTAF